MEINRFLRTNLHLIIDLILYFFLAIFSLNYYHFYLSADGISYISIAVKYLNGDWLNAINGVWSPFYSWLMVPIIALSHDPFNAAYVTRVVSLIAGFFTIIGISKLASTFNLENHSRIALLITSVPLVLFIPIFYDTPDLLVTCMLIFYFSFIFKQDYSLKWTNGALCGFFGGLAFLSKSYALPFFLVHFIFLNSLYYFKGLEINRSNIKKNLVIGLAVFFVISSIWTGALSTKYDKPTISTAIDYNHAINSPNYQKNIHLGLLKPTNPTATSIWEDPSTVQLKDWSPFESWKNFEFQLELIWKNISLTLILIEYYSILSLAIIVVSLYLILKSNTNKSFKQGLVYLIFTIFLYSGGYILIMVQDRFFLPVILLLMLTGFYLMNNLFENKVFSMKNRNILLAFLMLSFIFAPAYELTNYPNTDSKDLSISKTLQKDYNIHGNIASNDFWLITDGISFYLGNQYYGVPQNVNNSAELEKELINNNITYYFVWGNSGTLPPSYNNEITNGGIQDLRIYSVNSGQ